MSMIEEEKNPFSVMFLINVAGAEKRILDEIKKQIKTWKREFKRLLHMREQKIRKEWKQCLIVYDLKELHKKDYSEIAAIVYPLEKNDYPDYPITKKVRKNYDRAYQLIQGDYKRYIPEIALSAI
ncbi:MAG: hypothetical protein A2Z47_10610 [Thermodesulfovibrio sp. RBG_19FT_COMBO_42_12]|nr:MAG: hypothetical protein A2Z47_10610 [Thermodesulfovibrio sp. RBG_19FT_COMBO_42_12]